jgi:hypothetical protein
MGSWGKIEWGLVASAATIIGYVAYLFHLGIVIQ